MRGDQPVAGQRSGGPLLPRTARAGEGWGDDRAFAAGIGFTDIVKRPTARARDVTAAELAHGRDILLGKLERHRPGLVIFTFKRTATALLGPFVGHGPLPEPVGGCRAFVMPGPYERRQVVDGSLEELARTLGV